jgi:hypothetical protein
VHGPGGWYAGHAKCPSDTTRATAHPSRRRRLPTRLQSTYLLRSERPSDPKLNAFAYPIFEVLLQTGAAAGVTVVR